MHRRSFLGTGLAVAVASAAPLPAAAAWKDGAAFAISWGTSCTREVTGRVRGCWGIFKNFSRLQGEGYTLTHLPSGFRAGEADDLAVMERLAGTLDRISDFQKETPDTVRGRGLMALIEQAAKRDGLVHQGALYWKAA